MKNIGVKRHKKIDQAFTLVELLAVIVILALILAIAVPSITTLIDSATIQGYQSNEKMLARATRNYMAANLTSGLSNPTDIKIIKISDLVSANFLSGIKDIKDKTSDCTGYVIASLSLSNALEYKSNLKCGTNYMTSGYLDEYMSLNTLSSVEVLVVAGGGSGGGQGANDGSGGGGAGGLIYNSNYSVAIGTPISVMVGKGGTAVTFQTLGNNGDNSTFGTLTAIGGGGGGSEVIGVRSGKNGGSGGGAGGYTMAATGGIATSGQGNNGGANVVSAYPNYGGGGGGGAGSVGVGGTNQADAIIGHVSGGNGLYYGDKFGNAYGVNGWFAGGGGNGGGYGGQGGIGGSGGGGQGGHSVIGQALGTSGITNTGGGGGGAGGRIVGGTANSGTGGSGIVLIRYPGIQKANGGTVTTLGGYTIHAFTTIGASTFTALSF